MRKPEEYLDEMERDSTGTSAKQWYDFLTELRDELEIRIETVRGDVERETENNPDDDEED